MVDEEFVLVTETKTINEVGSFQGYSFEYEKYMSAVLTQEKSFFVKRDLAEESPQYKQLIPYVVLRHGNSLFTYTRGKRSSEHRLTYRMSLGLGGHISYYYDLPLIRSSYRELYFEGVKREVREEVEIDSKYEEQIVAVINDDSNGVGKVHFGIVHVWDLEQPNVTKREGLITQVGFFSPMELERDCDKLESWSKIVLNILRNM